MEQTILCALAANWKNYFTCEYKMCIVTINNDLMTLDSQNGWAHDTNHDHVGWLCKIYHTIHSAHLHTGGLETHNLVGRSKLVLLAK